MSESDADKIRNKRLAKLGGPTPSPAASGNNATPVDPAQDQARQHSPKRKAQSPQPTQSGENPFSKLGMANGPPSRSGISITPAKRQSEAAQPAGSFESLEDWEDKVLAELFRITLDVDRTRDVHGHKVHFVSGVRRDLEQERLPLILKTSLLDQALVEAVSEDEKVQPLDYLLACWKRVRHFQRNLRTGAQQEAKQDIVKEARRLCMSYCVFAATMPEMFGREAQLGRSVLAEHLLRDPASERGLDADFMQELVSRIEDDTAIQTALVEAVEELSVELSKKSMNDEYRSYVIALQHLVRYPQLVNAIVASPRFSPESTAAENVEKVTLLGPFFHLSPLQGTVALNYFSAPRTRDRAYILNSQNALRLTLKQHQEDLFFIADRFIKSSKESREKMLDWFAMTVNLNHKRRAIRVDQRSVSTDGFMVNVTACLDRLCEPFMDASFSKIGRIEQEYLRRDPRVKIQDETKINADQPTSDRFYEAKASGTSNFISEVFFLTVAAHHYGTEAANTKLDELRRQVKYMDKELEKVEAERINHVNRPTQQMFDARLNHFKQSVDKAHCVVHATEGILLDEQSQARSMSFIRYIIVWLMRLVSGVDFPKNTPSLPLPEEQPEVFKCLPEYFLEDVVDHFKFVTSHMPHVVSPTQCDELVMFCITLLRSSDYIKNPYLKSGLVSILFYGVMPLARGDTQGVLGGVLNAMPFAHKHLLHALMQWYIECEVTGSHTQFYDKFNIRYEIFHVIKCIWGNVIYREQLATEATVNLDFFVRYVNLLLNDVTYVLDESFTAFNQITSLSVELKDSSLSEEVRKEKTEALEAAQGRAKSYMSLTNETVSMLKLFTEALADSFTMPEIVQRLADMLDYNLDALTGPKQHNLKVDNKAEYKFDPAGMLSDIMDIYLNLRKKPSFHTAVARDGRSYIPENFARAAVILKGKGLKSDDQLGRWRALCQKFAEAKVADEAEEQDLEDAPDEFMDPLLSTLMTDPVMLPISKNVVDRSTIRQHLLSDAHDPFNRSPLKIEDVVPDHALREQIEAWKADKKAKRVAAATAVTAAAAEAASVDEDAIMDQS